MAFANDSHSHCYSVPDVGVEIESLWQSARMRIASLTSKGMRRNREWRALCGQPSAGHSAQQLTIKLNRARCIQLHVQAKDTTMDSGISLKPFCAVYATYKYSNQTQSLP